MSWSVSYQMFSSAEWWVSARSVCTGNIRICCMAGWSGGTTGGRTSTTSSGPPGTQPWGSSPHTLSEGGTLSYTDTRRTISVNDMDGLSWYLFWSDLVNMILILLSLLFLYSYYLSSQQTINCGENEIWLAGSVWPVYVMWRHLWQVGAGGPVWERPE